jgi:hypothetical protein
VVKEESPTGAAIRLPDDDRRPLIVHGDEVGARVPVFNGDPYARKVGFREERVARNEVGAREINEAIDETTPAPPAPSSTCCANAAWRTANASWLSPGGRASGKSPDKPTIERSGA